MLCRCHALKVCKSPELFKKVAAYSTTSAFEAQTGSFNGGQAAENAYEASTGFTGAEEFAPDEEAWTETQPLSESEKQALLRGIIRANILSEEAASKLAKGQRCLDRRRPDLKYRQEREQELLAKTESLAAPHRARPSLLRPLASVAGLALGGIASVLPKNASAAITGGVQEALVEQYNDQLRELRLHDLADLSATLRETIRELRDEERAPSDATQAPDLMKMQRPQDLSSDEILAGVVKYGMKGLFALGSKV